MHILDAGKAPESGILMKTSEPAKEKFENLLEQHAGIVRKVAFGYARNENDRRDLTQDILLQLWKAYPRYSPGRPFSTWMYRIALNVAISALRKQSSLVASWCRSMNRPTTCRMKAVAHRKWKSGSQRFIN